MTALFQDQFKVPLDDFRRTNKLKKIKEQSQNKNVRINLAKKNKELFLNSKREHISNKIKAREHRMQLFTPENVKNTSETWISVALFQPYLENIAEKFNLHKESRARTHKLGKVSNSNQLTL